MRDHQQSEEEVEIRTGLQAGDDGGGTLGSGSVIGPGGGTYGSGH